MLVLTRKLGERIHVGNNVVVSIADIRGDRVRVGITAPPSVAVNRSEIHEQIQRERLAATRINVSRPGPRM